jgi:hypothetical protein
MIDKKQLHEFQLNKESIVFFMSRYAPSTDAYEAIERIGRTLFKEFPEGTFRSTYSTLGDYYFYKHAYQNLKREAFISPLSKLGDLDLASVELFCIDDFGTELVDELSESIQFDFLPNYPGYFNDRIEAYFSSKAIDKIETDGVVIAEMIAAFGSKTLNLRPADLIILYLTELHPTDILWLKNAIISGVPLMVVS